MRNLLIASAALAVVTVGVSLTSAQAAPFAAVPSVAADAATAVEQAHYYRRGCGYYRPCVYGYVARPVVRFGFFRYGRRHY